MYHVEIENGHLMLWPDRPKEDAEAKIFSDVCRLLVLVVN